MKLRERIKEEWEKEEGQNIRGYRNHPKLSTYLDLGLIAILIGFGTLFAICSLDEYISSGAILPVSILSICSISGFASGIWCFKHRKKIVKKAFPK